MLGFCNPQEQVYALFSKCGDIKRVIMGLSHVSAMVVMQTGSCLAVEASTEEISILVAFASWNTTPMSAPEWGT